MEVKKKEIKMQNQHLLFLAIGLTCHGTQQFHHTICIRIYSLAEQLGDWTEQVKIDFEDFLIPLDFDFIKKKSKECFKNLVKIKAKEYSLTLLIKSQNNHSKMKGLYYTELKAKEYLKIKGIKTVEAQNLF